MIRRMLIGTAMLVPSLAFTIPTQTAHASVLPFEPEMIAHVVGTQTVGPAGASAPNDRLPWGLDRIDQRSGSLDNSYTYSADGTGVKVYIVDSGVDAGHTEFGSRVIDGWSYRADSTSLTSYKNQLANHASNPSTGIAACDDSRTIHQNSPAAYDAPATIDSTDKGKFDNDGHGTHVAGTVAGTNTGVAKGATIVPVRVLDSCGVGSTTMVLSGLNWIKSNVQGTPGTKAIVNMSIGFDGTATSIDTKIRELLALGIVVVAAAGNDSGSSCSTTPAGTPGTISVGASGPRFGYSYSGTVDVEGSYSNFGSCVDIFAPGTRVLSTWPYYKATPTSNALTHTYIEETGTSMAAPHVVGVIATYLQSRTVTTSTPADVWAWLNDNATCDAVTYSNTSLADSAQTPNRILNTGSAAGPACRPSTVTASVANRSTTVTWTEPASPNGSAVTGYTATLSPGGATCSTNASTFSCTFSGLTNNTVYTASVRATNAIGTSALAATTTVTPLGLPLPVANLVMGIANNSLVMSWSQQAGDGTGITYVATATPGGASCTTTSTTCTITGLTNGVSYSVSVVGTNSLGAASAVTATGTPDGEPEAPTSIATTMASRSITLSWPAITTTLGVTYKVTATPGGASCTTTTTTCTIIGLKNGTDYTFTVITVAPSGKVSTSSVLKARPGFTVKTTLVKLKSRTLLSKIVTTASKGKKTWTESGLCSIVSGRLVAPAKKATCKVTLKVAKSGSYPAMSTTVAVAVT